MSVQIAFELHYFIEIFCILYILMLYCQLSSLRSPVSSYNWGGNHLSVSFLMVQVFLIYFLLSRSVNISIMMIMMMMIIIIKRRCSIFVVIISIISPFEMQLSLQQQQKSCRACTLHIQSVYRQQDEAEPLQQPAVKGQSTVGGGYQRAGGPCRRV